MVTDKQSTLSRPAIRAAQQGHTLMTLMSRRPPTQLGFSLLELLAVVAILGILAALVLPHIILSTDVAKEKTSSTIGRKSTSPLNNITLTTASGPQTISPTSAPIRATFPDGLPVCPVSGDLYTIDPTTHRVVGHNGAGTH